MTKEELDKILFYHAGFIMNINGGKFADLSGAGLSGADLSRANLSGANLSGAYLSRANLSGANLSDANLSRADLSGADLSDANLSGADLSDANLSRANLSGAGLSRANLSRANLSRANLSGAELDYSCLPLWCGSLKIGSVDKRFVYQILTHATAICNSCDDPEFINVQNYLLKFVKKSHINTYCEHIKKRKHERCN